MNLIWKLCLFVLIISAAPVSLSSADAGTEIICASTTSTQNSGLFEHILPLFEKKTGIRVRIIAVGTGAALEIGKRGDADVLIVHSKKDELKMAEEGWFVNRHNLMYNDFVIVGPPSDPASIRGMKDAKKTFKKIAAAGALFVSRGDGSGTNRKEIELWRSIGLNPKQADWYLEAGQGMARTLRIAGEKKAYTLADRGTYLSLKDMEELELVIALDKDPALFNQYGIMAVNPGKHPFVRYREAMKFIEWLVSEQGQRAIASFKDRKGNRLFFPNAE